MIIDFGRHRGEDVQDVPTEYLSYLLGTGKRHLSDELRAAVGAEFARRIHAQYPGGCWYMSGSVQGYCEGEAVIVTFGAHKGRRLCDLPDEYLGWLAAQSFAHPALRSLALDVLADRIDALPRPEDYWAHDPDEPDPFGGDEDDQARANDLCSRLLKSIDFDGEEARP